MEGILDQFQFHQPIVACTLIGLVTRHLEICIILGGTLQIVAIGWANIGAAVAPDAALASVSAAILLILSGKTGTDGIRFAQAAAITLGVVGLFLTMLVRTISIGLVHGADAAAKHSNIKGVERAHFVALLLQGLRIAIPAFLLLLIDSNSVKSLLDAVPDWLAKGMDIGGGMVAAVGYAMVINMMATREVWPFFAIGFVLAAVPESQISLIGLGAIGIALALLYLNLSKKGGNGGNSTHSSNDPIGDILEDY